MRSLHSFFSTYLLPLILSIIPDHYPNFVIFISETSVEFVIFSLFLQPQLLQTHLSPANLTTVIHYTLASHKLISTNFNAFKIHWHVQTLSSHIQNTNKSTTFISFQQSFISNTFCLQGLLIHLFFLFHVSDHHLAKGLSLSSVQDSGIHSPLTPGTYFYSCCCCWPFLFANQTIREAVCSVCYISMQVGHVTVSEAIHFVIRTPCLIKHIKLFVNRTRL